VNRRHMRQVERRNGCGGKHFNLKFLPPHAAN
jgi:hypothetical protein